MRAFLILAVLVGAPVAQAQAPTQGFFVSPRLYAAGAAVESSDEVTTGGGLGLRLGYGFSKTVTAFAAIEGAGLDANNELFGVEDATTLGSFDLGAEFHILPSRGIDPFLRVAFNATTSRYDIETVGGTTPGRLEVRGRGLTLGAGVQVGVSRTLDIELALDLTGGTIEEFEVTNGRFEGTVAIDEGFGASRLGVGLVWRP
ncbi:MAG: hypothetical protein Rubg2KO_09030 [Rubricoccaceae bacterium]